jgi:hypothetical protein
VIQALIIIGECLHLFSPISTELANGTAGLIGLNHPRLPQPVRARKRPRRRIVGLDVAAGCRGAIARPLMPFDRRLNAQTRTGGTTARRRGDV